MKKHQKVQDAIARNFVRESFWNLAIFKRPLQPQESVPGNFGKLAVLIGHYARCSPHSYPVEYTKRMKLIAQLRQAELFQYVAVPAEKFARGEIKKLQEEGSASEYKRVKRAHNVRILIMILTLLMGVAGWSFYYFIDHQFLPALSNIFFALTICTLIEYIAYCKIMRRELFFAKERDDSLTVFREKSGDHLKNFFETTSFSVRLSNNSKTRDILEYLEKVFSNIVLNLCRTHLSMSVQESRQLTCSFGGIASEISLLSDLIASLALSETRTTSLAVV